MIGCNSFAGQGQDHITIFIHGTLGPLFKLVADKKLYACSKGLHPLNDLPEDSYYMQVADILHTTSQAVYNKKHFYTFGWSGELSFSDRSQGAQQLAYELEALLHSYKKKNKSVPYITLIGFSHGGNVALQVGKYLAPAFFCDVVLIATPIQKATEQYVELPAYKHIYVIASKGDVIQVLDPQNLYASVKDNHTRLFSRRFLQTHPKVKQACVTVNNKKLGHIDLFRSYMQHVISTLSALEQSEKQFLEYNVVDPGFIRFEDNILKLADCLVGKRKNNKV